MHAHGMVTEWHQNAACKCLQAAYEWIFYREACFQTCWIQILALAGGMFPLMAFLSAQKHQYSPVIAST